MKQNKQSSVWMRILFAAAAVILIIGVPALLGCGKISHQTAEAVPSPSAVPDATPAPVVTTDAPSETPAPSEEAPAPTDTNAPPQGYIPSEEVRLNYFLTSIVQQNIENTLLDLDEDAELIRFAFGYCRANKPEYILEQEDGDVTCRTITLEQVNETLTYFFGKTVSPEQEDYSILTDGDHDFHCVFRDGTFWNIPPYPAEEFSFPIRFALVDRIDEEACTVHFRLYRMNPYAWEEGEAERHVGIMPMLSIYEAESGRGETRNWIRRIGEGEASFRDFGEELQLIMLTVTL